MIIFFILLNVWLSCNLWNEYKLYTKYQRITNESILSKNFKIQINKVKTITVKYCYILHSAHLNQINAYYKIEKIIFTINNWTVDVHIKLKQILTFFLFLLMYTMLISKMQDNRNKWIFFMYKLSVVIYSIFFLNVSM